MTCRQFRFPDWSAPPNTQMLCGEQDGRKLACSYRGKRPSLVAVSHRCVPKSMVCTSEKLWFGFAPPTMKTFPFSASPTGGKYEQLWPTRGQGLFPGQVRVYHAAFLGLSPGSKMGSCFMVPYAEERKGSVQASSLSTTDPTMPLLTGLWRSSVVEHLPGMRKVEAQWTRRE